MDITDIRIYRLKDNSNTLALVSITIEEKLVIRNIRVVEGRNRPFVKMPTVEYESGEADVVFPINIDFREKLQEEIIKEYHNHIMKGVI